MSIFASQFRIAPTYDVGLSTGTPSVGATVGKSTKTKANEPAKVGASVAATAGLAAGAEAANTANNGLSSSNSNAASGSQSLSNQGTLNKLTHMESMNAGAVNASNPVPETNTYRSDGNMLDTPTGPTPKEATVSAPAKSSHTLAASGGGGLLHNIASGFDTARHSVSASTDWLMNTNDPNASSPNNMGSAKTYAPRATTRSGVVEPSNTWNPNAATTVPSASGNGSVIPGVSSPKAISMNGAYNEQQFGGLQNARDNMLGRSTNNSNKDMEQWEQQFGGESDTPASSPGIWGDIANTGESMFEKASKVLTSPEGEAAGSDD